MRLAKSQHVSAKQHRMTDGNKYSIANPQHVKSLSLSGSDRGGERL